MASFYLVIQLIISVACWVRTLSRIMLGHLLYLFLDPDKTSTQNNIITQLVAPQFGLTIYSRAPLVFLWQKEIKPKLGTFSLEQHMVTMARCQSLFPCLDNGSLLCPDSKWTKSHPANRALRACWETGWNYCRPYDLHRSFLTSNTLWFYFEVHSYIPLKRKLSGKYLALADCSYTLPRTAFSGTCVYFIWRPGT